MADNQLPSIEQLRQLIRIEGATGSLFWRRRSVEWFEGRNQRICNTWNTRYANKRALNNKRVQGYLGGYLQGRQVNAHRVVWALLNGEWPTKFIDHINHNRSDNRIENLRLVTNAENCRNQRLRKVNNSGTVGVYWVPLETAWKAQIGRTHIGTFSNKGDAIAARQKAEAQHGYHSNHGK